MHLIDRILAAARASGCLDERCVLDAPWSLNNAESPDREMPYHIVTSGMAVLRAAGAEEVLLQAGDIVVLTSGSGHRLQDVEAVNDVSQFNCATGRRTELLCGRFILPAAGWQLVRMVLPSVLVVRPASGAAHRRLAELISVMRDEAVDGLPGSQHVVSSLAAALFAVTLRAGSTVFGDEDHLASVAANQRLERVLRAVLERPAEHWTLDQLAKLANMSRSSLIREFERSGRMSPARFVTLARVAEATRLLVETSYSTAAIAESVGYASEAAFQRAYKRETGETPAARRRASSMARG